MKKVLVLPGDGIGQEVVAPAVEVMQVAAQQHGVTIDVAEALVGGAAIDDCGDPLPESTLSQAKQADAVLLGGVGGPKWDDLPTAQRPEKDSWACDKNSVCSQTCDQHCWQVR